MVVDAARQRDLGRMSAPEKRRAPNRLPRKCVAASPTGCTQFGGAGDPAEYGIERFIVMRGVPGFEGTSQIQQLLLIARNRLRQHAPGPALPG